jgi:GT2 family glycosyltransferase
MRTGKPVKMKPWADIIIPTHGQTEKTIRCLKSMRESTSSYRILWVDNGSSTESRSAVMDELRAHVDHASFWTADRLGFIGAVNLGLRMSLEVLDSGSPYVAILNNDIVVMDGWLDRMRGILDSDGSVHAVGPVTSECSSWQSFLNAGQVVGTFQIPQGFKDLDMPGRAAKLAYCYGDVWRPCRMLAFFCTLFRKDVFRSIGILDDKFEDGLGDDDDLCKRMADAGMGCALSMGTYVHHDHRSTFSALYSDQEIDDMSHRHLALYREKHGEEAKVR